MFVDINRCIGYLINDRYSYYGGEAVYIIRSDQDIREFYTFKEGFTYYNIGEASVINKGVGKLYLINQYINKERVSLYLLFLNILFF